METSSQKIETASSELLKLLVTEEEIDLSTRSNVSVATTMKSSASRRSSVVHIDQSLPPGEAAESRRRKMREELRDESYALIDYFSHKNSDALVYATKVTLEKLRRVLTPPILAEYTGKHHAKRAPVLKLQLELCIPNLIIKPSLEDVQQGVGQIIQVIFGTFKTVYQWGQDRNEHGTSEGLAVPSKVLAVPSKVLAAQSIKSLPSPSQPQLQVFKKPELKNFCRLVSEHKEIAKIVSSLSTMITTSKTQVIDSYKYFNTYQHLWQDKQSEKMAEFLETDPSLEDFENKIRHYERLEETIMSEDDQIIIVPLLLDACKLSLITIII